MAVAGGLGTESQRGKSLQWTGGVAYVRRGRQGVWSASAEGGPWRRGLCLQRAGLAAEGAAPAESPLRAASAAGPQQL